MPTNQQRREASRRKLERQLARRREQERARRQRLIVIGAVAAVLVISGGVWLFVSRGSSTTAAGPASSTGATASSSAEPTTPCSYSAAGTAAKQVNAPANLEPLNSGTVQATMTVNGQEVPITLDRTLAPCGVNSFLSLASQGFYDGTDCHRLTASDQLNVLQCGDPTGKGNGGPGYGFATEAAQGATYPVGTVALANASGEATSNGSQFFIAYGPTTLSPQYTVLGTVTGQGMTVIQQIAAKGVQKGAQDGPPVEKATIEKVTVPGDALEGTGTYVTATPSGQLSPSDQLSGVSPDPSSAAPPADSAAATTPASSGGAG